MGKNPSIKEPDSSRVTAAKIAAKSGICIAIVSATAWVGVELFKHYASNATVVEPGQPTSVSSLEQQLNAANVLLAGNEDSAEEYRGHLETSGAINALAESVRDELAGKRLRQPLHLNVINGRYKELVTGNTDGANLPTLRYEDDEKLREAMMLHWNEFHPTHQVEEFQAMLE